MTRWKRAPRHVLFTMHEHNLWSQWLYAVLYACDVLGVPVARRSYYNQSGDGSVSTDYYVCEHWLARVGGIKQVKALADEKHREVMALRRAYVD